MLANLGQDVLIIVCSHFCIWELALLRVNQAWKGAVHLFLRGRRISVEMSQRFIHSDPEWPSDELFIWDSTGCGLDSRHALAQFKKLQCCVRWLCGLELEMHRKQPDFQFILEVSPQSPYQIVQWLRHFPTATRLKISNWKAMEFGCDFESQIGDGDIGGFTRYWSRSEEYLTRIYNRAETLLERISPNVEEVSLEFKPSLETMETDAPAPYAYAFEPRLEKMLRLFVALRCLKTLVIDIWWGDVDWSGFSVLATLPCLSQVTIRDELPFRFYTEHYLHEHRHATIPPMAAAFSNLQQLRVLHCDFYFVGDPKDESLDFVSMLMHLPNLEDLGSLKFPPAELWAELREASSIDRSSIPKLRVLYLRYEDVLLCPKGWDMVGALGAMVGGIRDLPHFEVLHLLVDGESRGRMREDVEELTLRRILAGLAESSLQEVHYTSSIDWCGVEMEADVEATCDILRACLSGIAFHEGEQTDHLFLRDPEPNHKSDMRDDIASFSC